MLITGDQVHSKHGEMTRTGILKWINEVLDLQLTRIEELGSGSVYCQLLDAGYPDRVPLNKIKWDAKVQVDFIHNYKILQECFEHLGINKKIEIEKLSKANYQDNLYFIQWMKGFLQKKIQCQNKPMKKKNNGKLYTGFIDKKKFYAGSNNFNKENHQYLLSFREYHRNAGNNMSMTNLNKSGNCSNGFGQTGKIKNISKLLSSNKSFDDNEFQTHTRKRHTNTGGQLVVKRKSVGGVYSFGQEGKRNENKNQGMSVIKEKDGEVVVGDSVDEIF